MAMVGPPSWLESCANAVGSQLKNPVRPRWCCARPLLCCCFGTGRATWTRTEVGTICQSYYLGFGAGNAAEMATELKEDEEPAADRVWGTGGRELVGLEVSQPVWMVGYPSRGHPHTVGCWFAGCVAGFWALCQNALHVVLLHCTLCLMLWLVVGFGAHADSQQLG